MTLGEKDYPRVGCCTRNKNRCTVALAPQWARQSSTGDRPYNAEWRWEGSWRPNSWCLGEDVLVCRRALAPSILGSIHVCPVHFRSSWWSWSPSWWSRGYGWDQVSPRQSRVVGPLVAHDIMRLAEVENATLAYLDDSGVFTQLLIRSSLHHFAAKKTPCDL